MFLNAIFGKLSNSEQQYKVKSVFSLHKYFL